MMMRKQVRKPWSSPLAHALRLGLISLHGVKRRGSAFPPKPLEIERLIPKSSCISQGLKSLSLHIPGSGSMQDARVAALGGEENLLSQLRHWPKVCSPGQTLQS